MDASHLPSVSEAAAGAIGQLTNTLPDKVKGFLHANSSESPATNGISPPPPDRASPIPFQNGSSPYAERPNPLNIESASPLPQTVSSSNPKAAAAAASDMRNIVRRKLTGYVGFANLPNQWHRKSVRKGFNFNVMVVGTCFMAYFAKSIRG